MNTFAVACICNLIRSVTFLAVGKNVPEPTRIMKASMTTAALFGQRREMVVFATPDRADAERSQRILRYERGPRQCQARPRQPL